MTTRDARPPDLEMRVRTLSEHGRTRLTYTLHSPTGVVPFVHREIAGPTLQGSPEDFQRNLLRKLEKIGSSQDFDGTSLSSTSADRKLTSLGRDLWRELIPLEIREAYREIRRSVHSWMIVSDEPWIPWELIKPYDASRPEEILDDEFLCLRFELTRWLAGDKTLVQCVEVRQLAAFVTATDLPHAEQERCILMEIAQSISTFWDAPSGAGSAGEILDFLETAEVDLLHFIGHGFHSAAQPDESGIPFPDDSVFRPGDLQGPLATHIGRIRPLVFLNVCGAGQQGRSLTSLGGWAARWVGVCGCGAFVAPMWPVRDKAALCFAETFYTALEEGAALGQAALEARQRVARERPGDPSALAYAVYGHPGARVQFGGSAAEEPGAAIEAPRVQIRRVPRAARPRRRRWWIGAAAAVTLAGLLRFATGSIAEWLVPAAPLASPSFQELPKPKSDPPPPSRSTRSASAPSDKAPTAARATTKTTAGGLSFEITGGQSSHRSMLKQALTREARPLVEEGISGWTITVELDPPSLTPHDQGGMSPMVTCRLSAQARARGPGGAIDLDQVEGRSAQFVESDACEKAAGSLAQAVLTRLIDRKGEP